VDVCFHLVMNVYGIDSVFTADRSKKRIHNKMKTECIFRQRSSLYSWIYAIKYSRLTKNTNVIYTFHQDRV